MSKASVLQGRSFARWMAFRFLTFAPVFAIVWLLTDSSLSGKWMMTTVGVGIGLFLFPLEYYELSREEKRRLEASRPPVRRSLSESPRRLYRALHGKTDVPKS